jgi:hypothetical protein
MTSFWGFASARHDFYAAGILINMPDCRQYYMAIDLRSNDTGFAETDLYNAV